MRKTLPDTYYLDHFHELLRYVEGPCAHLLSAMQRRFIVCFHDLPRAAQCLFVRLCQRKAEVLRAKTCQYDELDNQGDLLAVLSENGMVRPLQEADVPAALASLTRPELVDLMRALQVGSKLSTLKKAALVELASAHIGLADLHTYGLADTFIVCQHDDTLAFFLFLFFGELGARLNQFSLRDLGVRRTRRQQSAVQARFDTLAEAHSAFFYARARQALVDADAAQLFDAADAVLGCGARCVPDAEGALASTLRDKYLLALGRQLLPLNQAQALLVLAASAHPKAQEKVLRERYKAGDKEWVRAQLEAICEQPESDALLAFAEDFLARKFHKKRTSVLTDMLREGSQQLWLDENHRHAVERGVVSKYRDQGMRAYRSENRYWRALFGLTFWPLLFGEGAQNANEFDRRPRCLVHDDFYASQAEAIEGVLARLDTRERWLAHATKVAASAYGEPNGMFRWSEHLLTRVARLLEAFSVPSLHTVLRQMSRHYARFRDGFPDLLVMDGNAARLEEVKSPGDQLRKNQLLTIRMLREAGVDCRITQVHWTVDPAQPYTVVDIETTGGRARQHRIIEVGAVRMVGDEVVARWQSLIHPGRHIPQAITALTGIDNAMVRDAPCFADIADELREFLAGSVFVAHNVNFDYGFIKEEYARLDQRFSMPKLCTVREMRKARPGMASYSLGKLCSALGIEMGRHHRALSDAEAAAELLRLVNQYRQTLTAA